MELFTSKTEHFIFVVILMCVWPSNVSTSQMLTPDGNTDDGQIANHKHSIGKGSDISKISKRGQTLFSNHNLAVLTRNAQTRMQNSKKLKRTPTLSINQDLSVLANMVIARIRNQNMARNAALRSELSAIGKRSQVKNTEKEAEVKNTEKEAEVKNTEKEAENSSKPKRTPTLSINQDLSVLENMVIARIRNQNMARNAALRNELSAIGKRSPVKNIEKETENPSKRTPTLSINQDLSVLANMVIARIRNQNMARNEALRNELFAIGKRGQDTITENETENPNKRTPTLSINQDLSVLANMVIAKIRNQNMARYEALRNELSAIGKRSQVNITENETENPNKRTPTLSINQDLSVLANMVIARIRNQNMARNEALRNELSAIGKRTAYNVVANQEIKTNDSPMKVKVLKRVAMASSRHGPPT